MEGKEELLFRSFVAHRRFDELRVDGYQKSSQRTQVLVWVGVGVVGWEQGGKVGGRGGGVDAACLSESTQRHGNTLEEWNLS